MISDSDDRAGDIKWPFLRDSLKHTQLVELGENILHIGLDICRRQRICSCKGAHNLIKRTLPIAEFPDPVSYTHLTLPTIYSV